MTNAKRITLFAGHYGSGKTNIAVNYALALRASGKTVTVADLDIVNPYFRTKDSEDLLRQAGIPLISPAYANTNVDLPALPSEIYSLLDAGSGYAVLDIGGDDRGALALGRYAPSILAENNYEMLLVISRYRPLTQTPEAVCEVIAEIEAACGIRATALVNNSNLGDATTAEDILASLDYAEKTAARCGIPVKMTTVRADLAASLRGKVENLFPLTLQQKYTWN